MSGLGRRRPSDYEHVEAYPLRVAAAVEAGPVPVVLGIDWFTNFDAPVEDGNTWWIGRGSLGSVRGGHCICARPRGVEDRPAWWGFYDQGSEGACVGFGWSRCMTLLNRHRYDAGWLYRTAQEHDEFSDTPPAEGTSVRAGGWTLANLGAERIANGKSTPADPAEGIASYRWATSWEGVRAALGLLDSNDGVPLLNSWGMNYPHVVRLVDEVGAKLLDEGGEVAVPVDR